ncbi:MAG: tetratricopeptide repeat protein, partial [bacterium]
ENYTEAIKWANYHIEVAQSRAWQAGGYMMRGLIHYMMGGEAQSLDDFQTAIELMEEVDNLFWKTVSLWGMGWIYYERGNTDSARVYLENPLDSIEQFQYATPSYPPIMDYELFRASARCLLHIQEGDLSSAKARLAEFESLMRGINPNFADIASIYRSMLEAKILMAEADYTGATRVLDEAPRWRIPRFHPTYVMPYNILILKDIAAQAYIHSGKPEKAIAEYEWLTAIGPERKLCPLIHPLYHYRLALLYEENGQPAKAAERYERFLAAWILADRSEPEIIDAKQRLERLKNTTMQ